MLTLYALADATGTASFETCLCRRHKGRRNMEIAVATTQSFFADCQKAGVGQGQLQLKCCLRVHLRRAVAEKGPKTAGRLT